MKVESLKVAYRDQGVRVLVRAVAQVPLTYLAKRQVGAMEMVRLDPAALGAPEPVADVKGHLDTVRMHLDCLPAPYAGREGILVAHTQAQAMEFLLDHWQPREDCEPDDTIDEVQSRRGARHARVRELEERLMRRDEDEDPFTPRYRARRGRGQGRARFVWTREAFDHSFEYIPTKGGGLFLPGQERGFLTEDPLRGASVVERTVRIGKHAVPQWDVLLPTESESGVAVARGFIDGRWFENSLRRLDPRIVERFDEEGRLVAVADGDALLGEAMEARFLVRVPRSAPPRDPGATTVPAVAKALPAAFLVDSRSPVLLRADLPVIDTTRDAWGVLLRTVSGIFQPDAAPMTPPRAFRALAGRYVVACVPATVSMGGAA